MLKIIIAVIISSSISAEEQKGEFLFPPDVQYVINKSAKAIKDYYERELDVLIKSLNEKLKEKTRAGDLDTALEIKNMVKELEDGKLLKDMQKKEVVSLISPANPIVGKWKHVAGSFELKEDGSCAWNGTTPGKWIVVSNKLVITWDSGSIDTYALPIKNNSLSGYNKLGQSYTITKFPDVK